MSLRISLLGALLIAAGLAGAQGFDAGKAGFSVRYKDEHSHFRVNGVFLMPGEVLELEVPGRHPGTFTLASGEGTGSKEGAHAWKWRAPDSAGLYPFKLYRDSTADTVRFNAFVMVPASEMQGEYLQGYRIGKYPKSHVKGLDFYRTPKGFIRVDEGSAQALVSPHFRLEQFLCKQSSALPAFLLLKERLVLKLELVLEKANQSGWSCGTFHIMSGFRTPYYNKRLGNVKQSAHQFGGAADIFIDANPEDGMMDDLNGDGRSDSEDSGLLFDLVDGMSVNEFFLPYLGGIGKYSRNSSHGPFVHVDVRGFRATW